MARLTKAKAFSDAGMVLYDDQWRCAVCGYNFSPTPTISKTLSRYNDHLERWFHTDALLVRAALSEGLVPISADSKSFLMRTLQLTHGMRDEYSLLHISLYEQLRPYVQYRPSLTKMYDFYFDGSNKIVEQELSIKTENWNGIVGVEPEALENDVGILEDAADRAGITNAKEIERLMLPRQQLMIARRTWTTGEPWWLARLGILGG